MLIRAHKGDGIGRQEVVGKEVERRRERY